MSSCSYNNIPKKGTNTKKAQTQQGRILWFDLRTGKGRIVCKGALGDCFFDSKGSDSMNYFFHGGEQVIFEIQKTTKGERACNVRLIKNIELSKKS